VPPNLPSEAASQPYAWLTAVGRRTGQPRTVELWFALRKSTVYFLAGGGESANWVRNSLAAGTVSLRLASGTYRGSARAVEPGTNEDADARRLLAAKYQGWTEGVPLSRWARDSFAVAVDLAEEVTTPRART
jgi:deazaflavin-dependent oxidoreductase (nitroreductase family)